MENEKYIVTIDGPDCTGKSTLWTKANEYNKNIQIRGIVSNIAYAIKYNRSVEELIDLYNENPVNYVVYLLNPINDKKLEMLYNRLRNNVYNNDFITKELKDASETWRDYQYFEKAKQYLIENYKGKIEFIEVKDNDFTKFVDNIKLYEIDSVDNYRNVPGIKIIDSTIDDFEAEAKNVSEFKYIVFINKVDKNTAIDNLYMKLDEEHKEMLDKLFTYSNETAEDVYDALETPTVDNLIEYLDDYELRVEVEVRCDIDTSADVYVPLRDIKYDVESAIYDNDDIMNDLYDAAKEEVYNCDLDISVE